MAERLTTSSCCEGAKGSGAENISPEEMAQLCKALGHPARVRIVTYLIAHGTCYFGNLSSIIPLSPSTISQHLSILKDSGLILGSADDQRTCYCVDKDRLALFKRLVASL